MNGNRYGYAPYAAVPFAPAYPMAAFGAEDSKDLTLWEKTKEKLNEEAIPGLPNKYTLVGATALGLIVFGAYKGWFA